MPPRIIKHRPWGGIGWERSARLILRMRADGATEAQIDQEQASLEWASAFGRMWRYIGQHARLVCGGVSASTRARKADRLPPTSTCGRCGNEYTGDSCDGPGYHP